MIIKINNTKIDDITLFDRDRLKGHQVSVGIDSSKSNSAVSISRLKPFTREVEAMMVFEFNGTKDGTREQDYFKLCLAQKAVLHYIFDGVYVRAVTIEDTITKAIGHEVSKKKFVNGRWITVKEDDQYKGLDIHKSRMATSIMFSNFNMFFLEKFGKECILANVGTWKKATIPEEFRTRDSKEKESHRYLKTINPKLEFVSDDYTDAVCINKYGNSFLRDIIEELPDDFEVNKEEGYSVTLCDVSAMDEQYCVKYDERFDFSTNCDRVLSYIKRFKGTPRASLLCNKEHIDFSKITSKRLGTRDEEEKYVVILNEQGDLSYA